MNRRTFNAFCGLGLPLGLLGVAPAVRAQTWPDKPVRLILSQAPGSGVDNIARLIEDHLGRKWGQTIIVENKPGGQNVIGAQAAARSPADGYTFYFATAAALVTNPYLFQKLPYDPKKDFSPVGMVAKVPFALLVNPSLPVRNFQEFVAYAKAKPGRLSLANEGPKTFSGMLARLLNKKAGIDTNLVAYVSVSSAVTDTVGGQTDAVLCDVASAMQMVKAGRLRPIAVTTAKTVTGWESVPPLANSIPGFEFAGWLGIVAPVGTPEAAVRRFNRDLDALLLDKDIAARLLAIGPVTEGAGTPEQFASFLQNEHARWSVLTKDIGILPE